MGDAFIYLRVSEKMAQELLQQFFRSNEELPAFTEKPRDGALVQRIEKVAEFASRNGPDFVQIIENKQHHNADYQFLFGGEGYDYYRWHLYELLMAHGTDPGRAISAMDVLERVTLPEETEKEFCRLLDRLDGSKDSTRSCVHCFLKCASMSEGLAKLMYYHTMQLTESEKQLDVAYLIHDILLKGQSQCSSREFRQITESLEHIISGVFAKIHNDRNQDEEVKRRLSKLIGIWNEYEIYSRRTIDAFEQAMLSGNLQMSHASTSESQSHDPLIGKTQEKYPRSEEKSHRRRHRSQSRERKSSRESKHFKLPPHMATTSSKAAGSHATHAWGPTSEHDTGAKDSRMETSAHDGRMASSGRAKTRAAFDPPPEKFTETGVVDTFSFPPGLIPSLVAEKRKQTFSYCPISPSDIPKFIYPTFVDPNDPYLKSRVEKFYAELDEYRPGMVREHVESRKRKEEDEGEQESGTESRRQKAHRADYVMTEDGKLTAMLADGSFAGEASDSMYTGLGAHCAAKQTEEEKAFNEYRKLRSDVYHNVIPKGVPPSTSKKTR